MKHFYNLGAWPPDKCVIQNHFCSFSVEAYVVGAQMNNLKGDRSFEHIKKQILKLIQMKIILILRYYFSLSGHIVIYIPSYLWL